MGSIHLNSNLQAGKLEEKENKKPSITHHVNGLQQSSNKSDSFVVDMEDFSHIIEKKDINNSSRITLQRNFSRKGSGRYGEKKVERDSNLQLISPRATFQGISSSTLEKPTVMGSTNEDDHCVLTPPQTQIHHQISITNTAIESKNVGKRSNLRRPSSISIVDPRRIMLFFATLSCMGTILLIYFTLSMGKVNGDDK